MMLQCVYDDWDEIYAFRSKGIGSQGQGVNVHRVHINIEEHKELCFSMEGHQPYQARVSH